MLLPVNELYGYIIASPNPGLGECSPKSAFVSELNYSAFIRSGVMRVYIGIVPVFPILGITITFILDAHMGLH